MLLKRVTSQVRKFYNLKKAAAKGKVDVKPKATKSPLESIKEAREVNKNLVSYTK